MLTHRRRKHVARFHGECERAFVHLSHEISDGRIEASAEFAARGEHLPGGIFLVVVVVVVIW